MENSVDSVLLDVDGKRLMCEALYLLGVILLFMDLKVGHACCYTHAVTRMLWRSACVRALWWRC